jgi:biopolymer transport protein ExbB
MKIRPLRSLAYLILTYAILSPSMLVNQAMAQDSNLFVAAWENLGATFFIVFLLLIIAGITLIIFNSINVRRKAFIKDDVINPIMDAVKGLDIEGAKSLCDQYKLPVTSILKGGLERIQDDELDIEAIEKGLDENAAMHMSKPFTWINMLNTVGSIAPMIGLLGTVVGMIGAFAVLTSAGMGGEASKQMAGNIGSALWTTAAGLVVAIPCLVSYFLFKTKFGNIAAEVNQVTGEMVFTLVRAARGGFDEEGGSEEAYEEAAYEDEAEPELA